MLASQRTVGQPGAGRSVRQPLVTCNANESSTSRVRFQSSRAASPLVPLSGNAPEAAQMLWKNGALSQARRPQNQIVEPVESAQPSTTSSADDLPAPLDARDIARTVRAVVLAGGETRNPLTRYRSMPSVPMASALRLVDIPLNNCLRAGINKMYVLTQFQSHSLNSYISQSYPPAKFGNADHQSWVEVLAAQQTTQAREWYRGSADAIRRNLGDLTDEWRGISPATDYVILSGAALYTMDLSRVLAQHRARGADITICTHLVSEEVAPSKGIVRVHSSSGCVLKFEEKPSAATLASQRSDTPSADGDFLANMGIYVFKREALLQLLDPSKAASITHIGHHVIPAALAAGLRVFAHQHRGYWHDMSTLRDYYEANLDLTRPQPPMSMFDVDGAVASKGSMLPPAQMIGRVHVESSILDEGSVLAGCTVRNSVVGECVYIGEGSVVEESLLLGSPEWTTSWRRAAAEARGERVYGVGSNCVLQRCIVDENATVGDNCRITNAAGVKEADRAATDGFMIQDGLVVVMRGANIKAGTII